MRLKHQHDTRRTTKVCVSKCQNQSLSMEPAQLPVAPSVLVIGGSGMLGWDVVSDFEHRGWPVTSPAHSDLDICFAPHIENLRQGKYGEFEWVVNCAAYTQVDKAETEAMAAMTLNSVAPGAVAAVCAERNWRMLQVSTDFVFDGLSDAPYTEGSEPRPLGVYGKSKRLGEENVLSQSSGNLVVRTAWLYGDHGKCFPRTVIEAWREGKELRVVEDQVGCPTYTRDLARVLGDLVAQSPSGGIVHAVGADSMSWHAFALAAIETYRTVKGSDRAVSVQGIKTAEWPTPAKRPPYSVLSTDKLLALGIAPMRPTRECLIDFVASIS